MKTIILSALLLMTAVASAQQAAGRSQNVVRCSQYSPHLLGQIYDEVFENKRIVEADVEAVRSCNDFYAVSPEDHGDMATPYPELKMAMSYCVSENMLNESERKIAKRQFLSREFRRVRQNFATKEDFLANHMTNSSMSCAEAMIETNKLLIEINK